jgi:hypothetical protein
MRIVLPLLLLLLLLDLWTSKTFSEHLFLDKAWNPRLQTYSGLSEILERQQTGASLFNYFSTTAQKRGGRPSKYNLEELAGDDVAQRKFTGIFWGEESFMEDLGVSKHHLVFHNLLMRNAGTQNREALEMAPLDAIMALDAMRKHEWRVGRRSKPADPISDTQSAKEWEWAIVFLG